MQLHARVTYCRWAMMTRAALKSTQAAQRAYMETAARCKWDWDCTHSSDPCRLSNSTQR